jgi:acylpyruvate hydrolase
VRWATLRSGTSTRLAERLGDHYVVYDRPSVAELFDGAPSVGEVVERVGVEEADVAPLIPSSGRVVCVGLNYADHVAEMGRELPKHPTIFAKFTSSLTGAHDYIRVAAVSQHVDWEAELAVVIGQPAHRVDPVRAQLAIGGYAVANDITMRDWQRHSSQWLPGKAFDACTPLGPELVTPDEVEHADSLDVECLVDGAVTQKGNTAQFIFTPADVISYVSQFMAWQPGDVLLTGTPGGVGAAGDVRLAAGQTVEARVEGIGSCVNKMVVDE